MCGKNKIDDNLALKFCSSGNTTPSRLQTTNRLSMSKTGSIPSSPAKLQQSAPPKPCSPLYDGMAWSPTPEYDLVSQFGQTNERDILFPEDTDDHALFDTNNYNN